MLASVTILEHPGMLHLRAFALADPVPGKLYPHVYFFYLHPSLTLYINIYSSVSDYS